MPVKHEYQGVKGVKAIAKHVGISPATLYERMKQGMTLEEAITAPVADMGMRR